MPIVPNFLLSQTTGLPSVITIEDTSTGSDVAIAERRVFFQTSKGEYLIENGSGNFIVFPIATDTLNFNILDKDYALRVTVQWVNNVGTVLYTKVTSVGFTLFNESFLFEMTQAQNSNPNLIRQPNFYDRKTAIRENVDSGNQAISFGNDIVSAQVCYDAATKLRANQSKYF